MPDTNLTMVVLAAGIGSRYGGLKQVDPVGPSGEMIIDYSVYDALQAGFNKVVFVITEAIQEVFHERVGKTIERKCETAYAFQRLDDLPPGWSLPRDRIKPWGTAHATLAARRAVGSPFAVINADDFYGRAAFQAIAAYLGDGPRHPAAGVEEYCMVGYRLENTLTEHGHVARGVCEVDATGYLASVRELTHIERGGSGAHYTEDGVTWHELPLDAVVSMNMWGFTPSLFLELERRFAGFLADSRNDLLKAEYFLPSVVNDMIVEGRARVKVLATSAHWYGMTYIQDRPVVTAAIRDLVRQGVYPESLWS